MYRKSQHNIHHYDFRPANIPLYRCSFHIVTNHYMLQKNYHKLNPLMGTLKPQSNGPLFSNAVIGTLAVDGRAVTFGTARRSLGRRGPAQSPPRCIKCNSPPINGQCTNFILFDVALKLPLHSKGLSYYLNLPIIFSVFLYTSTVDAILARNNDCTKAPLKKGHAWDQRNLSVGRTHRVSPTPSTTHFASRFGVSRAVCVSHRPKYGKCQKIQP